MKKKFFAAALAAVLSASSGFSVLAESAVITVPVAESASEETADADSAQEETVGSAVITVGTAEDLTETAAGNDMEAGTEEQEESGPTGETEAFSEETAAAADSQGEEMQEESANQGTVVWTNPADLIEADYEDVAYATRSTAQVMNIYLPENPTGSDPLIVLIHGGGFMFGSQNMALIQPVIAKGQKNGYVVVSIDYRKSLEAPFPAALADAKASVRYLKANAEKYGINPAEVTVWGESAGAYLAAMTALTPAVEALDGDVTTCPNESSRVQHLVDFYGPIEFYTLDAEYAALGLSGKSFSDASSFESSFLGQALDADEAFTYTTWWGSYVDALPEDFALTAWIQAGDADESVPCTQSVNFAEKLADVLGEENVTSGLIEGAAHEDALFYTDENLDAVFAFLSGKTE